MEDWTLSQLNAHLQFCAGRLDSLRWIIDRVDLMHDKNSIEELNMIKDRVHEIEATTRECESFVRDINNKRTLAKQKRLDEQKRVHAEFGTSL